MFVETATIDEGVAKSLIEFNNACFHELIWDIYSPFLLIISFTGIFSKLSFDFHKGMFMSGKRRDSLKKIVVALILSLAVASSVSYMASTKESSTVLRGIKWESFDWDMVWKDGFWRNGAEVTRQIWLDCDQVDLRLDVMTKEKREFIMNEVSERLPYLSSSQFGLPGCGGPFHLNAKIFENFLAQFITIRKFVLSDGLGILVLISISWMACLHLTVNYSPTE